MHTLEFLQGALLGVLTCVAIDALVQYFGITRRLKDIKKLRDETLESIAEIQKKIEENQIKYGVKND